VLDLNFPDTQFHKQKQTGGESAWWEFWDVID